MTFLQEILIKNTAEALRKVGIKGTFTFNYKIEFFEERYIAIGSTKIDGKTFTGSVEIKKHLLNHVHDETDEFTIEVTNEE